MIYTIDRETPAQGLEKATHEQLDTIRDRVIATGIPCTASYWIHLALMVSQTLTRLIGIPQMVDNINIKNTIILFLGLV